MGGNEVVRIFGEFVLCDGGHGSECPLRRNEVRGDTPHDLDQCERAFEQQADLEDEMNVLLFKECFELGHGLVGTVYRVGINRLLSIADHTQREQTGLAPTGSNVRADSTTAVSQFNPLAEFQNHEQNSPCHGARGCGRSGFCGSGRFGQRWPTRFLWSD